MTDLSTYLISSFKIIFFVLLGGFILFVINFLVSILKSKDLTDQGGVKNFRGYIIGIVIGVIILIALAYALFFSAIF